MGRNAITIRLRGELIDRLDDEAEDKGVSRSEYVREILENRQRADELQDELEALRDRLESREDRIEAWEEQRASRSKKEDKVDELAIERRKKRQQDAPFFNKWYRWYKNQWMGFSS